MLYENYIVTMTCLVPIIVGLSEVVKRIGIPAKLIPLINIVFGIAAGVAFVASTVQMNVLCGIVMGLSASGLFSGVKNVSEQFTK